VISSSSQEEFSSSSVILAVSPKINKSNFQFKANHNQIYLKNLIPDSRVSIADVHGAVKFNGIIPLSEYQLNTTSWATGIYFINIIQPNKTINHYTVMVIH
jgi:hypothetical protein